MNKNELLAELKRKDFTQEALSKKIGMDRVSFWKKINRTTDFTLTEIKSLVSVLELTKERMLDIFFN